MDGPTDGQCFSIEQLRETHVKNENDHFPTDLAIFTKALQTE